MTFQEFTEQHKQEAFTQAVKLRQQARARAEKEFSHSTVIMNCADIVFEQKVLLTKWWRESNLSK